MADEPATVTPGAGEAHSLACGALLLGFARAPPGSLADAGSGEPEPDRGGVQAAGGRHTFAVRFVGICTTSSRLLILIPPGILFVHFIA